MKELIFHFFPTKFIQRRKKYIRKGLYKPCDTKFHHFICHIYKMVKYLNNLPPFGAGKRLTEDKIL